MVELASHGLITHETEKETSSSKQRRGSRLDLQQDQNDDLFDDIDPNSNSLVPMNTVLTRVAPRLLRTVQSIEGVDDILPIFDKVKTKTMESNNDGISTTRNTPIPPTLPTLTINSTSDGDNGEGDGEGAEEDETEDDLGASQVMELVDKHLFKYQQSSLTPEHFKIMNAMRMEEKQKQNVHVSKIDIDASRKQYVLPNDNENKEEEEPATNETANEKKKENDSNGTVEAERMQMKSNNLSPTSNVRDSTGKYGESNYDNYDNNNQNESLLDRERESILFPRPLVSSNSLHGSLTSSMQNALFEDSDSFLGHLDTMLGPIDAQKKSSRPRKQLVGEWPFE